MPDSTPISFPGEDASNACRETITELEPRGLRTYTPTLAVLARSEGIYHWTADSRKLYDYTSGVLVANLGHNPPEWLERFWGHLGWTPQSEISDLKSQMLPLTAYNATTPLEAETCRRLIANLQSRPGGKRLEQIFWAASGSEAIQKALWACLHRDEDRDIILATRGGFHGKKGVAGACTGDEKSPERDPRVRFIAFPIEERKDVTLRGAPFDAEPYEKELAQLKDELGPRLSCLITEPYLGGAGSYHPPAEYLQLLQRFCRDIDMVFILDEVQSNFGRTGNMYAFETYGIEPDIVVLGKGIGNGAPVAAAVGRADVFGSLDFGEGSDTYSANPLCCAAVLATLECFEDAAQRGEDVIAHSRRISALIEEGLLRLKELPFVTHVRGEGMVWGVEVCDFEGHPSADVANACVRACYLGDAEGNALHLMGPLAGNVLRISPPLTISEPDTRRSLEVLYGILKSLAEQLTEKAAVSA
jgi:4-aminobutyrate aminotransferase-like enzyme